MCSGGLQNVNSTYGSRAEGIDLQRPETNNEPERRRTGQTSVRGFAGPAKLLPRREDHRHRSKATAMRPNFLIFVTDQHRADHLGCYGNAIVRTPHIDALASAGARFDRAYVANPVCMPNRGSIMTSRMPSVHGARGNGVPLPLESVTFADLLAEFGYRTALVGKSHIQNMEDLPPLLPPASGLPDTRAIAAFSGSRGAKRATVPPPTGRSCAPAGRTRSTGSAAVLRLPGRDAVQPPRRRMFRRLAALAAGASAPNWPAASAASTAARDPRHVAPQAWQTDLDEYSYPTHYIAEQTRQWIRRHVQRRPDQPFALMCSFPDPHHPWTPPGRYWDMYDPDDMPLPPSMKAGSDGGSRMCSGCSTSGAQGKAAARRSAPVCRLGARAAGDHRADLRHDHQYRRPHRPGDGDAARERRRQNTVVIFTSDHGDLMGDHGIVLKGPLHYQGLIRVPLIWREPRRGAGAARGTPAISTWSLDRPACVHPEPRRDLAAERRRRAGRW